MVFYSYEFLKSKVQQIDYIQLGLTLFVIVILAIALYRKSWRSILSSINRR